MNEEDDNIYIGDIGEDNNIDIDEDNNKIVVNQENNLNSQTHNGNQITR